ncbi:MAG: uroporphyrin-III methyltransferase [Ruminococcus sp.]|nr:uroporphyrin-III methyltransferase [Ruminococcus sp.]MBQ2972507.1 uroporphyrin-III methyltransferase [Ruminococcus sp.]
MFDFNFDGNIDAFEMGLSCMILDEIEKEEKRDSLTNNLSFSGLDETEFELMSDDEREEFLLDNDLDIDSFDFD